MIIIIIIIVIIDHIGSSHDKFVIIVNISISITSPRQQCFLKVTIFPCNEPEF